MPFRSTLAAFGGWISQVAGGEIRWPTYTAVAIGVISTLAVTIDPAYGLRRHLAAMPLLLCAAYFAAELLAKIILNARAGSLANYALSGVAVIDAVSAIAIPVSLLSGADVQSAALFGVFWLFKPVPDIAGIRQLRRVVARESGPLVSVLVLFLIVLFIAASAAHVLERDVQPNTFGSLPAALWWAVVTLTTTGYGDVVPITPGGRVVAALLMICGVGVFGLWTGILATGFAAENRRHNFIQTWESLGKVPFFAALGPATLADVTSMLRRVDLRSRVTVIRKGQSGDCMYFVAAGEVEVELPGKRIVLGVGSFFGELALLGSSRRSANVVTTRSSTLLVLDLIDFRALMARHPELAQAIDVEAQRRSQENAAVAAIPQ